MNSIIDETHETAKRMLAHLAVRPLRVREVWKLAVMDSISIARTATVFYWLRDKGFIRKREEGYCAPYEITKKGLLFYQALKEPSDKKDR